MIYRFLILSDETGDFVREIKIDSEASFLDLHNAIIKSTGYSSDQMSSFFICNNGWERETEITLVDMGKSYEEDNYTMETTPLEDLVTDEGQKLMYVFDYMTERAFFIELREIVFGKTLSEPLCSRSEGAPPPQVLSFDEIAPKIVTSSSELIDEDFYGDSEYDMNELDSEGFDGLDNLLNPFEEERY
ncbi:MAG: plasmid pRiA4b ORF-3 family protein [Tannerellaceae bacterium]|jgi:hypothetical protein|nr:plasmid pRiA4b ORF-3 family protein [Tannerellaceae bacterium]